MTLADEVERLVKCGFTAKEALEAMKEAAAAAERKEAAEREFELKKLQLQGAF